MTKLLFGCADADVGCLEVEHTGLHSQFYDKFNIRYHLSQVMMSVWDNPTHRKKLLSESK